MASYYLGIDGGGTRTRAWLADETGHLLGHSEGGPANRHLLGIEAVAQNLADLLVDLWSHYDHRGLAAAACGLAGVTGAETRLTRILRDLLPPGTPLLLTSDARIALTAAHAGGPGAILVSGTGSICLARSAEGRIVRSGGRGPLLDDAGSARWIGRRALETAARQSDGRQPGRQILDAVRGFYAAAEIDELPSAVQEDPETIPRLAPLITALAESGDPAAGAILDQAIAELCALVRAARAQAPGPRFPLALTGGLIEGSPHFRRRLETGLNENLTGIELCRMRLPPVAGAVIEARAEVIPERVAAFVENLASS